MVGNSASTLAQPIRCSTQSQTFLSFRPLKLRTSFLQWLLRRSLPFDPSIICTVLELDPSSASILPSYNLVTCQYNKIAYHPYSSLVSNLFSSPSLSQNSLNPSSFVLEPSLQPPKPVLHRLVDPLSVSYHTAASSDHSGAIAAKMATIYAAK
ncbi:hypothetical protein D8674_030802 [Pyrus ussuriensis x Pyrus communis]|uniref:Uncharacterized protein n=1 Tax=Pyrus ussuriensis x Pyrus communis TaxID=2448454 RepID=A0A5N5F262_9ROSA|nr:hypothetical protein D8674_030802 [Pyrus ussuriensis x Pyrus communis]